MSDYRRDITGERAWTRWVRWMDYDHPDDHLPQPAKPAAEPYPLVLDQGPGRNSPEDEAAIQAEQDRWTRLERLGR